MAGKTLPRGITPVQWRNATTGEKRLRYRVRITRAELKANKLFDTLQDAKDYLNTLNTKKGVEEFNKNNQFINEILRGVGERYEQSFLLGSMLEEFSTRKALEVSMTEQRKRAYDSEESKIKVICSTVIVPKTFKNEKEQMKFEQVNTKFGEIKFIDLEARHVNAYIRARKTAKHKGKSIADGTIKREVGFISSFVSRKIKRDELSIENKVFNRVDFSLLNVEDKEKKRMTQEQESKLFEELQKSKSKQILDISKIALLTGMRKSEIIFLTTEKVKNGFIQLSKEDTKTREARKIYITDEVREILDARNVDEGRYFTYTIDGFNKTRRQIFLRAGCGDFTFHSLRREFISRILASDFDERLKAKLARIGSSRYFEEAYVEKKQTPAAPPRTFEEVQKHVGHSKNSKVTDKKYIVDKD